MAAGTVTVEIFSRSWTSYGTITSAFLPKGTYKQNDVGDGIFVIPIYDTPAKTLAKYNRIAVVTVEDTAGGSPAPTVCAFHIQNITPRRIRSNEYDGYVIEVSGAGILAELQWDNIGYSTISDGSQGPTNTWVSDCLSYAQESWSIFLMSSLTTAANAYLQAAGESVWDALLECSAQCGRVVAYAPSFATQSTGSKGREILFVSSPLAGNPIYDWDELNLVATNPGAGEVAIIDIEPMEDVYEIATRVTIYGAGIGADVLTIAAAQGNVTVPSGFSVDWTNSIITNTAMEAQTDQPTIHRLKQLGHIKPEDNEDATAVETAAIQLFWAGINYLRDRQVERRNFYRVVFVAEPGSQYTVGQLVNIVYAHTSPINSSGTAATTNVIDINGNFVVHEMTIEVPNDGPHKGVRLINMVVGSPITSDTYTRGRATGDDIVITKLKEHDEVLRHATASYAPSTPGGDGTYATADAPFLVLGNTTNLTNERLFVAGAGLAATDGGANSTYTVNVVAADTSLTINANDMQVRLAATSGLQISTGLMIADTVAGAGLTIASKVLAVGGGDGIDVAADSIAVDVTDIIGTGLVEEATNNIAVDFSIVAALADLHDAATAGDGIDITGQLISVDVTDLIGNGLTEVATNNIALGTPSTLAVSSTNAVTASSHTHAITSSSDPGAAASLLATDSNGAIFTRGVTAHAGTNADSNASGSLLIAIGGNTSTSQQSASAAYNAFVYSSTAEHIPTFRGRKALGTRSTPSAVGSGTVLARFGGAGWNGTAFPTESNAYIEVRSTQTHSGTAAGSHIRFGVTPDDSTTAAEVARLEGAGRLLIAETSNAYQTIGVTINMSTNTNEIATYKQSNVAHGMTSITDTNTFGAISIRSGTQGGMVVAGYHEGTTGLELNGVGVTDLTGKAAASEAYLHLNARKKSGAGATTPGANANLVAIRKDGTTVWIVDTEGDTHRDGTDNTFDIYHDAHLARAFDMVVSPGAVIDSEFDAWVEYGRADLVAAGILHESGFYNESRLLRLAIGAVWQEYTERQRLTRRVNELERRLLN